MAMMKVFLFGGVRIAHDDQPADPRATKSIQALLAFLVIHRHHPHRRDVLAGLFWGDSSESRARSCLSTALWRLRAVLEPQGIPRGTYLRIGPADEVGIDPRSDLWL